MSIFSSSRASTAFLLPDPPRRSHTISFVFSQCPPSRSLLEPSDSRFRIFARIFIHRYSFFFTLFPSSPRTHPPHDFCGTHPHSKDANVIDVPHPPPLFSPLFFLLPGWIRRFPPIFLCLLWTLKNDRLWALGFWHGIFISFDWLTATALLFVGHGPLSSLRATRDGTAPSGTSAFISFLFRFLPS